MLQRRSAPSSSHPPPTDPSGPTAAHSRQPSSCGSGGGVALHINADAVAPPIRTAPSSRSGSFTLPSLLFFFLLLLLLLVLLLCLTAIALWGGHAHAAHDAHSTSQLDAPPATAAVAAVSPATSDASKEEGETGQEEVPTGDQPERGATSPRRGSAEPLVDNEPWPEEGTEAPADAAQVRVLHELLDAPLAGDGEAPRGSGPRRVFMCLVVGGSPDSHSGARECVPLHMSIVSASQLGACRRAPSSIAMPTLISLPFDDSSGSAAVAGLYPAVMRPLVGAEGAVSHRLVSFEFEGTGTFLSRDATGMLVADRGEARSFEHWMTDPFPSQRRVEWCTRPAVLRPAASQFQPDAPQLCVAADLTTPSRARARVFRLARAVTESETAAACAPLCVWVDDDEAPLHSHRSHLVGLQEARAAREHALALWESQGAAVAGPDAHPPPAGSTADSIGGVEVVFVSSLAPLAALKAKQRDGDAWVQQLAVFRQWQQLLVDSRRRGSRGAGSLRGGANSREEENEEDVHRVCPFDRPRPGAPLPPHFALHVVVCVEITHDIDSLLFEHPDMFARYDFRRRTSTDAGGHNTVPKIALTSECERSEEVAGVPTYRGLMAMGEAVLRNMRTASSINTAAATRDVQLVMYSNSDILFSICELRASLLAAVAALHVRRGRSGEGGGHLFVTGRRRNCNPSAVRFSSNANEGKGADSRAAMRGGFGWDNPSEMPQSVTSGSGRASFCAVAWRQRWAAACQLFEDTAQDYFIFTRGALRWGGASARNRGKWNAQRDVVPPFVVGGIAFDNWVVAVMNRRTDVVGIDATNAVNALHLNHGGPAGLRKSHVTRRSAFNSELGHENGGWLRGKTSLLPYSLVVGDLPVATAEGPEPSSPPTLTSACIVGAHDRGVVSCGVDGGGWAEKMPRCTFVHSNEDGSTDPPSAFDRPWVQPD